MLAWALVSDRAFDQLVTRAVIGESDELWEERQAYFGACPELAEGLSDLGNYRRTEAVQRAVRDIDSALSEALLLAIAEYERIWIPSWAHGVEAARQAIIDHETVWIELLNEELRLAARIEAESDGDQRAADLAGLAQLGSLADPEINATFEIARRRFLEAADSAQEEERATAIFAPTEASEIDCAAFDPVVVRWEP